MRILHVGKYYPPVHGGIENFIRDLAQQSASEGISTSVLVHRSAGADASAEPDHEQPQDHLTIRRVPVIGELAYAPISPGFPSQLACAIRNDQPDILHLHMPNTSAFWALLVPAARRLPWIVHWHADAVGPGFNWKLRLLYPAYRVFENALLTRARRVVVTSPHYLARSQGLAGYAGKCTAIPLGIDPGRVTPPPDAPGSPCWQVKGALRVLAVGRMAHYKGLHHLIAAARVVEGLEVILAGDGPESLRLKRLASAPGSASPVRLTGAVPDAMRNRLLATCDVVCLTSTTRAEAFGVTLLEAMAAGKPSIVGDVPGSGMTWVVRHEETGWHVPPGDAGALAARLRTLRDHRQQLVGTREPIRRRFHRHFDIRAVSSASAELYRAVLTEKGGEAIGTERD